LFTSALPAKAKSVRMVENCSSLVTIRSKQAITTVIFIGDLPLTRWTHSTAGSLSFLNSADDWKLMSSSALIMPARSTRIAHREEATRRLRLSRNANVPSGGFVLPRS